MQPTTMKAAILAKLQDPLIVDEVALPDKLDVGQVLVRVSYSGICGSQLGEIDGVKGNDDYLPHLLGHEGSGEVLEIGPGVTTVKTGNRVVLHWRPSTGIQSKPPVYRWHGKVLNAGWITTFNQYAVVSENRVTPIPNDFDLSLAPLFGCALTTGLGLVTHDAKLQMGESIVVFGAGGVGSFAIQAAHLHTAQPIIAIDLVRSRLIQAKRLGATHIIEAQQAPQTQLEEQIRQIVGSQGVDVAIETTGNTGLIELAYRITQSRGRTVLAGVPKAADNISIHSLALHFGKVLTGSHGGGTKPEIHIPRYIGLAQSGKLNLTDMITERFELTQINQAIQKMRSGEIVGRPLLDMRQEE